MTLPFDHYYLNEAGEAVKTTLTDLPKPTHWSYRAICWALEQGITYLQIMKNNLEVLKEALGSDGAADV